METNLVHSHLDDESERLRDERKLEHALPLIEAALVEISDIDQATIDRIWEGILLRVDEQEQGTI